MIWGGGGGGINREHTNTIQMAERLHLLENSPKLTDVLYEQVQNLDQEMYSITFIQIRKQNKTRECGSDVGI